jgi:iron complex outermembrane receptor protein
MFKINPIAGGILQAFGGVAGAVLAMGPATAQQATTLERVEVTGSSIKRIAAETAAPIETISKEDIQASGLQTIEQVVRAVTANNNGSISSSFTNGFSASGTAVSLRGLGPNYTLVLLNGRRFGNFPLADDGHASYADISQIPFDAVERIEVLKDGASSIYGSDAVAGVVNIILRQQYTGFTGTASAGTNVSGEGGNFKAAATYGIGDLTKDRYNAFVTADYMKQKANPYNEQKKWIGTNDLTFMGLPNARLGDGNFGTTSPTGNYLPRTATGGAVAGAVLTPLPGACPPGVGYPSPDGFCLWDTKDWTDLQPEIERWNLLAKGTFNFTQTVQGYAEVSYFNVDTKTRGTPTGSRANWYDPSTNSIKSSTNILLPVGNPDNPVSGLGQAARLYLVDAALGGRDTDYSSGTQRYLAGVKGTTMKWDWDVMGQYIQTDTDVTRHNFYSYDRLLEGLAGTSPYGYYRVGANASLNNPAIFDWIAPDRSYTLTSKTTNFAAKATRDIYELAGGPLGLAVGYEYRKEEINNPGVPGTDTGNVVGLGYSAAFGSQTDNAVFGELYAPILKNLEMGLGLRWDDYGSDIGSTTNWKGTVKWTALSNLVLRGTYATGFRAPGLYETSTANATAGFVTVVDPVRCPVTGAPLDCAAQTLTVNTGNPFIKPEKTSNYTLGFIWEPVRNLSGGVTYWNIKIDDQITIGSAQAVATNPSNFPAATITRDTNDLPGIPNSGTLLSVSTPFQNANTVKTDGFDVDMRWRLPLQNNMGTLTTDFTWTRVLSYTQTLGNETYEYVGTQGNYDVSSGSATPKDRFNLAMTWTPGPWSVTGTVRYVSGYQSIPYQGVTTPDECLSALDTGDCHIGSFTTLDLSGKYTGFKNWEIYGSIVNVFNRVAPFNPAAAYGNVNFNYNYAFSGGTGTQFNLGARYTY